MLENERLRLVVDAKGAQMRSLYDISAARELLWQGDSAVWSDTAPWLFPFIGKQRDDRYTLNGQTYRMPMHGFAKDMLFSFEQKSAQHAAFTLRQTPETLAMYPFCFTLRIAYALEGESVRIECRVQNDGGQPMYFSLGAHPGFMCQAGDTLEADGGKALDCHRLSMPSHLMPDAAGEKIPPVITLAQELFDADAMIFFAPQAQAMTLRRACGSVRVAFGSVPYLGVWSKKRGGMRYVCIEPWFGVDDFEKSDGCIRHKAGMVTLMPGGQFVWPLSITVQA